MRVSERRLSPRWARWTAPVLLVLLVALAAAPAAGRAPDRRAPQTQLALALGDSVAFGIGASAPDRTDYVAQLFDRLRDDLACFPAPAPRCRSLHQVDVSVPGATTQSLIEQQLPVAVDLLARRSGDRIPGNDVRVVTLTIGGNDVFNPVVAACGDDPTAPGCTRAIATRLAQVDRNLSQILEALARAAGPDTTIAVMTYYNPLEACNLAPLERLADLVLEGGTLHGVMLQAGLNDVIRGAAAAADGVDGTDVVVAETFGLLDTQDLVGGSDCLHPDDSGYDILTDRFAEAVR